PGRGRGGDGGECHGDYAGVLRVADAGVAAQGSCVCRGESRCYGFYFCTLSSSGGRMWVRSTFPPITNLSVATRIPVIPGGGPASTTRAPESCAAPSYPDMTLGL